LRPSACSAGMAATLAAKRLAAAAKMVEAFIFEDVDEFARRFGRGGSAAVIGLVLWSAG